MVGTGARVLAGVGGTFFGGPLLGKAASALVGKAADNWVDTGNIFGTRAPYMINSANTPGVNPSYGMTPIDIGGQLASREGVIGNQLSAGMGAPRPAGFLAGPMFGAQTPQYGQQGINGYTDARVNESINGRLARNEALIGQQLSAVLNARGGWVAGGGGARGAFSTGGYASEEARRASMEATQQALRESQNRTPNNRQQHNHAF